MFVDPVLRGAFCVAQLRLVCVCRSFSRSVVPLVGARRPSTKRLLAPRRKSCPTGGKTKMLDMVDIGEFSRHQALWTVGRCGCGALGANRVCGFVVAGENGVC